MLTDLGEAAKTLENLIHRNKVIDLIKVELDSAWELLTLVLELIRGVVHVLKIDIDIASVDVCCGLLIDTANLVKEGDVHAERG